MIFFDQIEDFWTQLNDNFFEHIVTPLLSYFHALAYQEMAFDVTNAVLLGVVELLILVLFIRPLENLNPVEHWQNRKGTGVDILYTFLHRLGLIPAFLFLIIWPLSNQLDAFLRLHHLSPPPLDTYIPGLDQSPVITWLVYLILLDGVAYLVHRGLHRWNWAWALHSLHHSQQKMSLWTDDRTHILEDFINLSIPAMVSLFIGIPPSQFLVLMMCTRLLQNLAHANFQTDFGILGRWILVSPHFHRVHHGIEQGSQGQGHSCNYAILFSFWDRLFRTSSYPNHTPATGINDQLTGTDYGQSFWRQQWLGISRLLQAIGPKIEPH